MYIYITHGYCTTWGAYVEGLVPHATVHALNERWGVFLVVNWRERVKWRYASNVAHHTRLISTNLSSLWLTICQPPSLTHTGIQPSTYLHLNTHSLHYMNGQYSVHTSSLYHCQRVGRIVRGTIKNHSCLTKSSTQHTTQVLASTWLLHGHLNGLTRHTNQLIHTHTCTHI